MHNSTDNLQTHVQQTLITPEQLVTKLPLSAQLAESIKNSRAEIHQIMQGNDKRLLIVVGPCSIHDTKSALEYAHLLSKAANEFSNELHIAMRLYFEKPRTTLGWKGLISDPALDGSFDMNTGLYLARKLLLETNQLGLAAATEFLDPLVSCYLSDLISWCAIGARTAESQLHRELASGLPMVVGFKNSTDGNIQIAIDAVQTAKQPHHVISINKKGIPTVMKTGGNPSCHIVLRGSNTGPNFSEMHIQNAIAALNHATLTPTIMIDCSHGNSMKDYSQQNKVIHAIVSYLNRGIRAVRGVMIESNLVAGKQTINPETPLVYGRSITDDCMGWDETYLLLKLLAQTVRDHKAK
jgi:3-deoxy-7-phosphoheptulonate synthase